MGNNSYRCLPTLTDSFYHIWEITNSYWHLLKSPASPYQLLKVIDTAGCDSRLLGMLPAVHFESFLGLEEW